MNEYPDMPGAKVDGPSAEAADAMAGSASTIRAAVLRTLIRTAHGMTADEIAAELRLSILTVRPRVSELNRMGVIHPTGRRGKNASGLSATIWQPVTASEVPA
jgi:predicted transcriptional regulator